MNYHYQVKDRSFISEMTQLFNLSLLRLQPNLKYHVSRAKTMPVTMRNCLLKRCAIFESLVQKL